MTLTSEQVNAIVYRYLQESGFRHSSFAFQYESQVEKSIYRDATIQPGMLINVIHKGLQFMDIEAHMNEDGELVECSAPFSLLGPHECDLTGESHTKQQPALPSQQQQQQQRLSSPTPSTKRQRKEDRRDKKEREKRSRKDESVTSTPTTTAVETTTTAAASDVDTEMATTDSIPAPSQPSSSSSPPPTSSTLQPQKQPSETTTQSPPPAPPAPSSTQQQPSLSTTTTTTEATPLLEETKAATMPSSTTTAADTDVAAATVNGHTVNEEPTTTAGGDESKQEDHPPPTKEPKIIDPSEAVILTGHHSEVFSCSWNPVVSNLLASGSGDATARLWKVPDDNSEVTEPIVLNHLPNLNDSKDVTTLDWNPSGTLLASGSYDGQARIWTQKGQLRFVMEQHRGPIFSLKWNMKGDLVLSGSADTTTVVWDPKTGEMKQQFELHSLAILDVDWMDNTTFASCSSDKTIYVCRVGSTKPLKKWVGHEDEINAVRWDPSGKYLASCSDDMTTKIWSLDSDQPIQEIRGHYLQIYTLQWAPLSSSSSSSSGSDSTIESSSSRRLLATGSFDATIRVWDALTGTCLHVLKNHAEAVYSISFSPDARLLASGSFDEILNVWDVKSGALQKTFRADGGIFEVHFNKDGSKLAACTSNRQVVILDMKS